MPAAKSNVTRGQRVAGLETSTKLRTMNPFWGVVSFGLFIIFPCRDSRGPMRLRVLQAWLPQSRCEAAVASLETSNDARTPVGFDIVFTGGSPTPFFQDLVITASLFFLLELFAGGLELAPSRGVLMTYPASLAGLGGKFRLSLGLSRRDSDRRAGDQDCGRHRGRPAQNRSRNPIEDP